MTELNRLETNDLELVSQICKEIDVLCYSEYIFYDSYLLPTPRSSSPSNFGLFPTNTDTRSYRASPKPSKNT